MPVFLRCIECQERYELTDVRYGCRCGSLLEVAYADGVFDSVSTELFDDRLASKDPWDRSGVWRFREVVCGFRPQEVVCHPEGQTPLLTRQQLNAFAGLERLQFKHEGQNPTGSFKDRGMTCAVTQAQRLGMRVVGCASTGNTSASLAAYAAHAGMKAVVFLPSGKVASGKMAQAVGYGADCLGIEGDFDDAMALVQRLASEGHLYMVNSLNPFRLEGQKTIMWEMLQDRGWQAPDWVVVPGGNLGNTAAFGKALWEAVRAGWIDKLPRIATIQAAGASPFYHSYTHKWQVLDPQKAETIATAIRIGNPVNFAKAKAVIDSTKGVVEVVSDDDILQAKALLDGCGVGCEPASACTLAGIKKLVGQGIISKDEEVVAILTGHILKDPEAVFIATASEQMSVIGNDYETIKKAVVEGG